jgi:hypothetical protein
VTPCPQQSSRQLLGGDVGLLIATSRSGERARPPPVTRVLPSPRLRAAIGHPAMAGAIRVAFGRLEPAIGEIPAGRVAERPSAGGFANVFEPHPPHLANLGFAKRPRRSPRRFMTGVGGGVLLASAGLGVRNSRQSRPVWMSGRPAGRGAAPGPVEFDAQSTRFANHGVAGRGAERPSDETRASSFKSQPYEILDRLGCPQHFRVPMAQGPPLRQQDGLNRLFSC